MTESINLAKEKTLFGTDKNPSNILPIKYTLKDKIQFRCHPGVSCFTQCCGNIKIVLTPYDILQLRRRLDMSAPDFLYTYAQPINLEKTDMPGVCIKLEENGRCPFIISATEGCRVYSDRPTACRYYPVGMANFHEKSEADAASGSEEFYFVVKEPHCKGFEEDKEWTIRDWRADQGVDKRDKMNKGWMELVMRRKSFGFQATLSEQAQRMFFMASTDLDQFRKFIFESSFLDVYEVDEETRKKILDDDVELMFFSFKYLASTLFGTEYIKIKPEKIQAKVREIKTDQHGMAEKMAEKAERELAEIKKEREKQKEETAG